MNILLVWPNKDNFGFKPISIALISAILKQRGHKVKLFDTTFIDFGYESDSEVQSRIKVFKPVDFSGYDIAKKKVDLQAELTQKLDDFRPDLVGISALSDEIFIGLEVSKIVKEWDDQIPILWGNKAATMDCEAILADKNVDYVCVGEGVEFITEFVDYMASKKDLRDLKNLAWRDEKGAIHRNELRPFFQGLDSLPFLDWSIFDHRLFLKPYDGKVYTGGDHMISWGCPNLCSYCINHAYRKLYGPKAGRFLRWYSVDRIIKELQYLVREWDINFLKFYDEDFCLKPTAYFQELAEKYQQLVGVPFTAMANGHSLTEEKVELLKQMNCVSISIGIETGNESMRKNILKRKETVEEIIRAVQMLNDAGIRTSTFNMLGIPFENRSTIMETIALNKESEVRYPNTVFFYPLKGTELRETAIKHGFFESGDETTFDSTLPALNLPDISEEELIALRQRFVLYVKMPEEYYKYIERSEKQDEVGKRLTAELYKIYDECVFPNDGLWNDRGRSEEYLERLEQMYSINYTNGSYSNLKDVPRRKGKKIDFKRLNRTVDWQKQIAGEQERLSEKLLDCREYLTACPVCSCEECKPFADIYKYPYAECEKCGHIFSQTPPNNQAIAALYADESDKHSTQRQIYIDAKIFKERIEQIARPKVDYCSSIIPVDGLWVDLGCGTGELLMAAAQKGWHVKGIETDPAEVEFGRKQGLDIAQSDVSSLKPEHLQNAKVLSLLNLLEHMRDPAGILAKLANALPAEAYVVVEVPRHPSLSSFVSLAFPHLAHRHIYAPDHLHVFTEKSVEIMLDNAGLNTVALWEFGQDFQHLISTAAANAGLPESEFLNKVVDLSATVQQCIDDMDFSDVLFVIASKK